MPESLFTFLFKYRPVVFENGRLVFEATHPLGWIGAALTVALVTTALYLRQRSRVGARTVGLLVALRIAAVAVILFALLQPALTISTIVPGENFLAVLIDDSRSMQLADDGTVARGDQALDIFTDPASELLQDLQERFTLRYYRFSDIVTRMDPSRPLAFQGRSTNTYSFPI